MKHKNDCCVNIQCIQLDTCMYTNMRNFITKHTVGRPFYSHTAKQSAQSTLQLICVIKTEESNADRILIY